MKSLLQNTISKYRQYEEEIINYTLISQEVLSLCLFLCFLFYIPITNIIEYVNDKTFNPSTWICIIQCIISLAMFLFFKKYVKKNKKYTLIFAYLNIIQIIFFLELQYFLYSYFVSYMMINCIIMSTTLTVISSGFMYFLCICPIFIVDTLICINESQSLRNTSLFIMDNIFIVLFALGIHVYFSTIKFKDFKLQQELLYLGENDSLTGLLNRNASEKFVKKCCHNNTTSYMLIIDIDNFKQLNDTLGHMKGDEGLIDISKNLSVLFENGECVSRLGGDEFMIFLPDIQDKNYVIEKAKSILNIFPLSYTNGKNTVDLGCSIGIASSELNTEDLYDDLYKKADNAMYEVKKNGKNKIKLYQTEGFIEK